MPRPNDVGVGVSVAIVKNDPHPRILLGQRKGAHGAGEWAFAGGWIDRNDKNIEETCQREITEELGTNLVVSNTNRLIETMHNYPDFGAVTLFRYALWVSGEPELREPEKCMGWVWYNLYEDMPNPLFGGVEDAISKLRRIFY